MDVTRRGFIKATAASTAIGAAGPVIGAGPAAGATVAGAGAGAGAAKLRGRRVAVLGGGVAGLTVAHELSERGFEVTVYERKALGGKARSIPVPGTGTPGRLPLPGEHGFRFFPGFYRNLPDTLRRIPLGGGHNAREGLVEAGQTRLSRANGREDIIAPPVHPTHPELTPDVLMRTIVALFQHATTVPIPELAFFARRMGVFLTSCDQRRFGTWEHTSWWDFVRGAQSSAEYQHLIARGLTRSLVAAKAELASTHTIGLMGEAFVLSFLGVGSDGAPDRLLNAPTNEAWIDPMVALLRRRGVRFKVGWTVEALRCAKGRISAASAKDPAGRRQTIEADWYVLAVPVERAIPLLNRTILAADPALAGLRELTTDWMNGIQFYLRERLPITKGHVTYIDAPWALTSISQGQFWKRNFAKTYGDGRVQDCLSVDVSNWDAPGILYGKPAKLCSREEIAREVWAQIKTSLNKGELRDSALHSWFLDPAIAPAPGGATNDEPLLINTAGSWNNRPAARTKIPNLFLAADYVRVNVNLATMEGANQAARQAANAIIDAAGSTAEHARLWELHRPPELEPWKKMDADRYRRGLPNLLDDAPQRPQRPQR